MLKILPIVSPETAVQAVIAAQNERIEIIERIPPRGRINGSATMANNRMNDRQEIHPDPPIVVEPVKVWGGSRKLEGLLLIPTGD